MIITDVDRLLFEPPDLDANDAALILQEAFGSNPPEIPDIPTGGPSQTGQDPRLSLPKGLEVTPGQTVGVPLSLENTDPNAITLRSFDIAIEVDPNLLSVSSVEAAGLAAGALLSYQFDATRGLLLISGTLAQPLVMQPGDIGHLFRIDFVVSHRAIVGERASLNILEEATLSDGTTFRTRLNEGELVLVPAPTNDDDDDVDGWLVFK